MDGTFTIPGGFLVDGKLVKEVTLREISGFEEDILADQKRNKGGNKGGQLVKSPTQRISEVLARCTTKIGDIECPDNNDCSKAKLQPFYKMWHTEALMADRAVAVIRLRQLSLGELFIFNDECPKCKSEIQSITIDLSQLKVDGYFNNIEKKDTDTEESIQAIRDELLRKSAYELRLPSGVIVGWRLLRASDEEALQDLDDNNPEQFMSALTAYRLTSIDGNPVTMMAMKRLSGRDRSFLRTHFDKVEGSIDTTIQVTCPRKECGAAFSKRMNVGDHRFFFPSGT